MIIHYIELYKTFRYTFQMKLRTSLIFNYQFSTYGFFPNNKQIPIITILMQTQETFCFGFTKVNSKLFSLLYDYYH